ncbi:MAG: hypothetical protein K0S56_1590 [Microvirga sp.]|jgi:hypothetical protein|nr:hypothetical protein [Microvirga sp.]
MKLRRPTLFEIEAWLVGAVVTAATVTSLTDYGAWIWSLLN